MKKGDIYHIKSISHRKNRDTGLLDTIIIGKLMLDKKWATYSTDPSMLSLPIFLTEKEIKKNYYSDRDIRKMKLDKINKKKEI